MNIEDARAPKGLENISLLVQTSSKKKKKYKLVRFSRQKPPKSSNFNGFTDKNCTVFEQTSMPEVNTRLKKENEILSKKSATSIAQTVHGFKTDFVVNVVKEHDIHLRNPFYNQNKIKIYRCQLATKEESCCCSCNSDAMFEVMKSLYDCYKRKTCDNCNCILCGHLPREERRLGEARKSVGRATIGVGEEMISHKEKRKEITKKAMKEMEGKSLVEKEKILRDLVKSRIPLPQPKTGSEKELVKKIKTEYGLPPEPKTSTEKVKMKKAEAAGMITPLSGKTPWQKEKILKGQAEMGISLPAGRTPSEKALIEKIKTTTKAKIPSEKWRKAKEAGLLTPLEDKTQDEKEKILKGLAMQGLPLPEGKTPSEKKMIERVRTEIGLPPEPKTTPKLKSKIPSEKWRQAKEAGLLTPLENKSPEQKAKILKGLAVQGLPLPEGKTPSEKLILEKVRADVGLPPEPKTVSLKEKYKKATNAGLMVPLEGKSPSQKEKILKSLADRHLPLPEGRTPSEKALITKVKATTRPPSEGAPISRKLERAKAAGLLTPLEGKTPEQKEKILKGLVMSGIPLPEAKTASEKKIHDKVRTDLGLPPEPKTSNEKQKYKEAIAAGLVEPLEGKSPIEKEKILQAQQDIGLPLPEGRTASERAIIDKIKSKRKKSKSRGISVGTPALPIDRRKTLDEKTARVMKEGKGPADECICDILTPVSEREEAFKVSSPPSITTEKLHKAKAAGLLTPLQGKSLEDKERILKGLAKAGLPLPDGKTASEKALIKKIKTAAGIPEVAESTKLRKAKKTGLLTPLEGKPLPQKEKILRGRAAAGLPLPSGKTPSEKQLIKKIKDETGYVTPTTSQKMARAKAAGLLTPLEGKPPSKKAKIIQERLAAGLPPPEGKTSSEKELIKKITAETVPLRTKIPSEKIRKAKAEGLLTPMQGKTPQQREKILRGLVKAGLPLPEPKTASEKDLINKVRQDTGLPPEPKTASLREKYNKAQVAGIVTPLEGKTPSQKEKILKKLQDAGIPLPEGRTASERAIIQRVKAGIITPKVPLEKIRAAKAAGLLTPIEGKRPEEKERILKGLAKAGMPLPTAKTPSEKEIIQKVKKGMGLPPEPKTLSMKERIHKAHAAGLITPLEGKTPSQKEKTVRKLIQAKLPPPEGRTSSEKAMIRKIKAEEKSLSKVRIPSEKIRKAKAAGLLTPLKGKTLEEKEKIMKGLAMEGIPLPEPKTASERKLMEKVRIELGLPPEPKTISERRKFEKSMAAGDIAPLEGKTRSEKAKILKTQAEMGMQLPEGRTSSEKALISTIKAETKRPSKVRIPSDKLRKAKEAGLLTPLEGKKPEEKERILKGLAMQGLPIPEPRTASDKKLVEKVRAELGLPPEPKTPSERLRYEKAVTAGIIQPLEGKTPIEKLKILKAQADMGLPLPEGRTISERALISQAKTEAQARPPSEKIRKAQAAGLVSPLEGKTPLEKERILRNIAEAGMPLPEAKTSSEKALISKVRSEMGLPPEPQTATIKEKMRKAQAAGLVIPLEGKTPSEKEKILTNIAEAGVPLPKARTPSEKALISRIQATVREKPRRLSAKQAKKLDEKTAKIMKEGKGPADECICNILTPDFEKFAVEPTTAISEKIKQARPEGSISPLEGKTAEQKEKKLRHLAMQGLPLPETKTASERKLAEKVRVDLGLPLEPKTASEKRKYSEALAAGVIVPLEGKTKSEKVKIIRDQVGRGIVPSGRSPSEKALIAKIKSQAKPASKVRIPSEKLRKAKADGLITPLEGKSPEEKKKIVKGLAMAGIPLPEAKTVSEKKIIEKVRTELGLPPEPKTRSEQKKYDEALTAGIVVPLEGKTASEKEKTLRAQAEMGLPLPEGRTPSEKALISKVKKETEALPSEKLRKARETGLITPLAGKTTYQKEKILKGMVEAGLPLPKGETPSEKAIISKIQAENEKKSQSRRIGGPPLPPDELKKLDKKTAKVMKEGKGPADECICSLLTPESERITFKIPPKVLSERLRKAQAAGLLTPLEGKTSSRKEKIMKELAMQGVPLPEAKTSSERNLAEKVRAELGLPPEPRTKSEKIRYSKAVVGGKILPLEGKTLAEKEKTLRAQAEMGLTLPEGRTPSEKAIISKVKSEKREASKVGLPSEKIRKAKTAGLLTPLEGKSFKEKEKIMRGLVMEGIPLPKAKTASEKKLIEKVRTELGLPPEPKSPSELKRYDKAIASGVIVPLEGKTASEKAKTLKAQAELGLPLPEGRTASEKALISKIKAEPQKIPSEKIQKAKAAGLITPLEGKTASQKEKIARGLAEMGLPLPETKTPSEKIMMQKIRTELGIPPPARTLSEKERIREAKAEGLLTPLAGKSIAQKEKILKGLAEAGLPLPEGKTKSEKELIKKTRTAAGLPPEPTLSERRGIIRSKSKKVGISEMRRASKGIGVGKVDKELAKAGIAQEFEDIVKSTTCDRGCGCDRKKIRFKHSYVKIRVTSPDISSLCPCPEECLPGVKGGVFTDNEGIKVTIGHAIGVPSYGREYTRDQTTSKINILPQDLSDIYRNDIFIHNNLVQNIKKSNTIKIQRNGVEKDGIEYLFKCGSLYMTSSEESLNNYQMHEDFDHELNFLVNNDVIKPNHNGSTFDYELASETNNECEKSVNCILTLTSKSCSSTTSHSRSSYYSNLLLKSDPSLCLTTNTCDSINAISIVDSSFISNSDQCVYYSHTDNSHSNTAFDELEYYNEDFDYNNSGNNTTSKEFTHSDSNDTDPILNMYKPRNTLIKEEKENVHPQPANPILILDNARSDQDITNIVDDLLASREFSVTSSSVYIVVTSSEDVLSASNGRDSTECLLTDSFSESSNSLRLGSRMSSIACALKLSRTGRNNFVEKISPYPKTRLHIISNRPQAFEIEQYKAKEGLMSNCSEVVTANKDCVPQCKHREISTDTTEDRPCCCLPKKPSMATSSYNQSKTQCVANVMSELIIPMIQPGISIDLCNNPKTIPDRSMPTQSSLSKHNLAPRITRVRICQVPPCAGHEGYQMPLRRNNIPVDTNQPPNINMKSLGCGNRASVEKLDVSIKKDVDTRTNDHPSKSILDTKTGKKTEKKVTVVPPCAPNLAKKSVGCQCCLHSGCQEGSTVQYYGVGTIAKETMETIKPMDVFLKDHCVCKNKPDKKSKIKCLCPPSAPEPTPELEPELEPDFIAYEDYEYTEQDVWKMRSEQTQTTSGFKMVMKKKTVESEMSFEEAIEYYASLESGQLGFEIQESQDPPKPPEFKILGAKCDCEERAKSKYKQCECPQEEPEPIPEPVLAEPEQEAWKGLKFAIGGKGSASKGLAGICCFDMLQGSNPYMLGYLDETDSYSVYPYD